MDVKMEVKEILKYCDHTLLRVDSSREEIKKLCDEGIKYECASVCIPPSFVTMAKQYVGDNIPICTVIGFPNGYSTTSMKIIETLEALKNGADEIDMVINVGDAKAGRHDDLFGEIRSIRDVTNGKILKVIIECCLLEENEKILMCNIVTDAGADFIKTSTGFSTGGATREDVALLRKHTASYVEVKAAGGIATLQDAVDFIELGATRLGTSRIVKIASEM